MKKAVAILACLLVTSSSEAMFRNKRAADSKKKSTTKNSSLSIDEQLLEATINKEIDRARMLLQQKANPNYCTKKGSSPLYVACVHGNIPLIRIFKTAPALDIAQYVDNDNKKSPLIFAASKEDPQLLQVLTEDCLEKVKKEDLIKAVSMAVFKGNTANIDLLLGKKPSLVPIALNFTAHFKKPAVKEHIIQSFSLAAFEQWFATAFHAHNSKKMRLFGDIIKEKRTQEALEHAIACVQLREKADNAMNHRHADNRLLFEDELRRHALAWALSANARREMVENARSLVTKEELSIEIPEDSGSESDTERDSSVSPSMSYSMSGSALVGSMSSNGLVSIVYYSEEEADELADKETGEKADNQKAVGQGATREIGQETKESEDGEEWLIVNPEINPTT